jgi:hypothetical protein
VVVLRPAPRRHDDLFDAAVRAEVDEAFQIVDLTGADPVAHEALLDAVLPEAFAIVGQPAHRGQLRRAVRMQPGARELIGRYRSRPVTVPATDADSARPGRLPGGTPAPTCPDR